MTHEMTLRFASATTGISSRPNGGMAGRQSEYLRYILDEYGAQTLPHSPLLVLLDSLFPDNPSQRDLQLPKSITMGEALSETDVIRPGSLMSYLVPPQNYAFHCIVWRIPCDKKYKSVQPAGSLDHEPIDISGLYEIKLFRDNDTAFEASKKWASDEPKIEFWRQYVLEKCEIPQANTNPGQLRAMVLEALGDLLDGHAGQVMSRMFEMGHPLGLTEERRITWDDLGQELQFWQYLKAELPSLEENLSLKLSTLEL